LSSEKRNDSFVPGTYRVSKVMGLMRSWCHVGNRDVLLKMRHLCFHVLVSSSLTCGKQVSELQFT